MNVENLKKLRARIAECEDYEGPFEGKRQNLPRVDDDYGGWPLLFHMRNTTFYCGAPACLQGHAEVLVMEEEAVCTHQDSTGEERVCSVSPYEWLGLSGPEAGELFAPDGFDFPYEPGYREMFGRDAALDTLDYAIRHKVVAWPHQRSTT